MNSSKIFIISLILIFVIGIFFVSPRQDRIMLAIVQELQAAENGTSSGSIASTSGDVLISDQTQERKKLEDELKDLEQQISNYEKDISKTQAEKKTLQNQISLLKKKIEKLNLQIQQGNLMITDLGAQISDTESSIDKTILKIKDSQAKLTDILRTLYEKDQLSYIEILLSEKEISDFFDDIAALEALNSKNQDLLDDIKNLKSYLEDQKQSLDGNKADLEQVVKVQLLQKQESEVNKKDKDYYLKLTEAQYQKSVKDKQEAEKKAAEIRARIFELIGVAKAPTFGEALDIAKYVEGLTKVRPAFLLAVMTQESNLGKNVGQCYLKDSKTGEGVTAKGTAVKNVMKPSRDIPPFLDITKELGRDPYNTPVSCPIPSVGGYGGAMGPAQFIPSTWMAYRDQVRDILERPADPWDIKDSFLAAALYVADYGATAQTYNAEWKAAMIYFSGSSNSRYRFYGDSVMQIAARYTEDIKEIEQGTGN